MIRTIRVLGAALGAFIGLGLAATGTGLFTGVAVRRVHPCRVDDRLEDRRVRAAPVPHGRPGGLAHPPACRSCPPRSSCPRSSACSSASCSASSWACRSPRSTVPLGTWLPLGISLFLGLGMMGLTVAKRFDLIAAAEGAGLVRRPGEDKASRRGRAPDRGRHQRPHRRPDRRDRRVRVHLRDADRAAVRARRAAAHRGLVGHPAPEPRPARPRDPQPDAARPAHPRRGRRRRGARCGRGGCEAGRAGEASQPRRADQRLQPQPRRRAPGRPGDEHQLAGQRREAGRPARRGPAREGHPGGQGVRARASASSTTAR